MIDALLRKLEVRDRISAEEGAALVVGFGPPKTHRSGALLVQQGSSPDHSTLMLSGFSARVSLLKDGSEHISAVHIPGDFVDLHSFLLHPLDHAVSALSDCTVTTIAHDTLRSLTTQFPRLGRLLWQSTLLDAAIHRRWLVVMGGMDATGHLAHFFCEQAARLTAVGLAESNAFDFPLTQAHLASALGLSSVHLNRTLQTLRARGLVAWTGGRLHILDWEGLAAVAEFDPTYL